jgi:hypothetical protein
VVVVPDMVLPLVAGAATLGSVFEVAICAAMGTLEVASVYV